MYHINMEARRFRKLLVDNGYYVTKARLNLFALLQKRPALTLQELISLTYQHDQATVYRNIDLLEKLGIVNRLRLGWLTKIELSDLFIHHHHHFTCTNCGKVYDLQDDQIIEKRIKKLALNENFVATDHQLEIRGVCTTCQDKQ